jgi:L-glutamine-phosphate cytidylyltransferase
MKAIILAAGQGTRLRPLTDNIPKCMVSFRDKPLIDYIIESLKAVDINNIVVIDGYKKDVLEKHLENKNVIFYTNENYENTNMVSTLFCAEEEMNDDIIISYSDIIYTPQVLEKILEDNSDFSVIVDKKWKELWQMRMENPLNDAETMKIDENNFIYELGKKPLSYYEVQGQYIGLIKISKKFLPKFINHYKTLDKNRIYDGKTFDNMFMTSFIQSLIDNVNKAKAIFIDGGWLEIDSIEDLTIYENSNLII